MAARLHAMRRALHAALVRVESPPPDGASDWRRVLEQRGMFTYTGLSREQARAAAGGLPFPPSPYSSPVLRPLTPSRYRLSPGLGTARAAPHLHAD